MTTPSSSNRPSDVLLIDRDDATADLVSAVCPGARVVRVDDFAALAELDDPGAFDLVVADVDLVQDTDPVSGRSAQHVLQVLRESVPGIPVILTTTFGTVEDDVDAMREGADLIPRPFGPEQLAAAIDRAWEGLRLRREVESLRRERAADAALEHIVTNDERMLRLFKVVRAVASARTTVLITGESGTGKSLLARALHKASDRAEGPFVEINCGAMPETLLESELFGHVRGAFTGAVRDRPGKFEEASGGTIFLDEIGTASPALQVRLLRVLQERTVERIGAAQPREVDVRIVLATNADLEAEVAAGSFREDLYYRICVVHLEVPSLRERPDDVPLLARSFLERYRGEHDRPGLSLSRAAMVRLRTHPWPGNVRQLENAIERAVLLAEGDQIEADDLPSLPEGAAAAAQSVSAPQTALAPKDAGVRRSPADSTLSAPDPAPHELVTPDGRLVPLREALEGPERRILEHALDACGGNRTHAAEALGINRSTLHAKMRKYGLL